jgi:beta-glucanase (GH16 family)
MKKVFNILLFFVCFNFLKAQIPINDPAWILQTSASEEFNAPLDTVNKWYPRYAWGWLNNGAEYNYPANLIQTGTTLKIKADTLTSGVTYTPSIWASTPSVGVTYAYQSGAISTRPSGGQELYKFGYIEGYVKVPTGKWPYWPALWVWSCSNGYNEIDYLEPNADDCFNGYYYGTNRFISASGCNPTYTLGQQDILNVPLMSAAFHKYATEWAPDRVNYYFDDVLVRSVYDISGATIPQNPMMAIVNFCIDPFYCLLPSNWNNTSYFPNYPNHGDNTPTQWPAYFEIDYLRYYKLNTACSSTLSICTPSTDYSARAVQQSITSGGACSPIFYTSDGYTLRATDYVLLDAGTTVNDNSSGYFAVIIQACPQ